MESNMKKLGVIMALAGVYLSTFMCASIRAADNPMPEGREVSTNSEHYRLISVDGRELKQGAYTRTYANGRKAEKGSYVHGEKDGAWTYWNKTGKKIMEENYARGKRQGPWVKWYDNGQKAFEGDYDNGNPVKTHREWRMDGARQAEVVYTEKNGVVYGHKKTW